MQQLARLAPGAVGHHQQPWLGIRRVDTQSFTALIRKQQAGLIAWLRQPPGQVSEDFADLDLAVLQSKRGQARRIQRMIDFAGMLQDQHPRSAGQVRDQRTQAQGLRALAARALRSGHTQLCHEAAWRQYRAGRARAKKSRTGPLNLCTPVADPL
ncbi:hypothetical protein AO269_02940 [Pseudomonas putida]|nr:hypothetical protein AO269_02940 [Pseudomonas putida]